MDKVNCLKCKHYNVTWDVKFPKGCRLLGIKSKELPCLAVYTSTGAPCLGFEPRVTQKKKQS